MASSINNSPSQPPLLPEIAKIVVGYAADSELNAQILKVGRAILERFPANFQAHFADITNIKLPNWPQLHVTAEQLAKLKEVYPQLTQEGVQFDGYTEVSALEEETAFGGQLDKCPPLQVVLNDGTTRTIMATAFVTTGFLSGWAVEKIDWKHGRDGQVRRTEHFPVESIRSVRRLAPDFETWARLQLPPVNDEGKAKA